MAASVNDGSTDTSGDGDLIRTQSGFDGAIVSTADPLLGPLADNGGPTQTMLLDPSSPAFAVGILADAPATDQRGAARLGWASIGAYQDSFLVVNANDSDAGSLRQVLLNANANPGTDDIRFSIPGNGLVISPDSALPLITDPVVLDGTSQPGWSGTPLIELNGFSENGPVSFDGLYLAGGASGSTIRGLAVDGFADGVVLDEQPTQTTLQGDYVGIDPTGAAAGNSGDGVALLNGASGDLIGGTASGDGNVIADNADGVAVVGATTTGDSILGNSIYGNTDLGIDLNDDGHTADGTAPPGPNDFQNYPVLTAAASGQVAGSLRSAPNTTYRIEFYATPQTDGAYEGETLLGAVQLSTDATGLLSFNETVTAPPSGWVVTATATDLANGDTSEFSPGPPVSVAGDGGSGQDAAVATAFTGPLAVLVTDAFGDPVDGVSVTFAAPLSGATATFLDGVTAVTNSAGVAGSFPRRTRGRSPAATPSRRRSRGSRPLTSRLPMTRGLPRRSPSSMARGRTRRSARPSAPR